MSDPLVYRFNPNHAPAGSATGGQFAAASGSSGSKSGPGSKASHAKDTRPTPTNQHPVGRGETGKRVSDLQSRLNALGFKPALKVDGIFGPKTLAAVKAFQKSHGLKVDGLVGPHTTAALRTRSGTAKHPAAHPASSAHHKAAGQPSAHHKMSGKPGSIKDSQKATIRQLVKDRKVPGPDAADATNPTEMSALAEVEAQALIKHLQTFPPRKPAVKRGTADPYGHEHYAARSRLLREQAGLDW